MNNICEVCKIEFETTKPAKTCSPKCRVTLARLRVTSSPNVTLAKPNVTHDVTFKFTVGYKPLNDSDESTAKDRGRIREAKYWYDVPLAAIPVIQKGWPKLPIFPAVYGRPETAMNGREYFLWWKNNFELDEFGNPSLFNPFPAIGSRSSKV